MSKIKINDCGLVGNLYCPDVQLGKLPGVILLSGSDGGIPGTNAIPESFIEALVANNLIVLALAYFGIECLPENLENIELEYFENAISWLKLRPQVKEDSIGIIGQSRGGELALILGTLFSAQIKAIVACAPSSMMCGGFPHPNKPAWRYQGQSLSPYLGGLSNSYADLTELDDLTHAAARKLITDSANTEKSPFIVAELFAARTLQNTDNSATIPVERIKCPLLLLSGDQDTIWPSNYYCQLIMNRLDKCNSTIPRKHMNYGNAGHGVIASYNGSIYHHVGKFWCTLGGSIDGNDVANRKSLSEVLSFFNKNLIKGW